MAKRMRQRTQRVTEKVEERAEHAAHATETAAEHTADDVLHAFRKGRADAVRAAERTLPVVKKSVSKGTYMLCYYLSFGAVYTAELAMASVPEDSVIRHGFKDGAKAAREAHAHRKTTRKRHSPTAAAA
ncbi:MAG TPA: hypothetical protein VGL82_07365 [Bryobacteraceae bacterium]|jgi:hypothetical protein